MTTVARTQINHGHTSQPTLSTRLSLAAKVAIPVIKALGAIFAAAGVFCAISGFPLPAAALLIGGAITFGLSFVCGRGQITRVNQQNTTPVVPSTSVAVPAVAFGRQAWIHHLGVDPGEEPQLPPNIEQILGAPCPFWRGTVADTHMLVLVPESLTTTTNGVARSEPFTLTALNKVIEISVQGRVGISSFSPFQIIRDGLGARSNEGSHWVLMTKYPVPGTREKTYVEQEKFVQQAGYKVPSCLEAATAILLQHIKTGEYPFGFRPSDKLQATASEGTTRCKDLSSSEPNKGKVVGGLHPTLGLEVKEHGHDYREYRLGMAGVRAF